MRLEVGKKYKDRFNTVFTIISDQAKPPYKYVGQSMTTGALIGFTYDGKAAHCSGELVEEVRKPLKTEEIIGTGEPLNKFTDFLCNPVWLDGYGRFRYKVTIEEIVE